MSRFIRIKTLILIKKGVKRGIARRFFSDIENWVKRYKRASA